MKHKTAELEGALLDAAVALAEGQAQEIVPFRVDGGHGITFVRDEPVCQVGVDYFEPSTNWAHGGPIIERELVSVVPPGYGGCAQWTAGIGLRNAYDGWEADHEAEGPTPLIAAMRAFVASKLGEEVELPG